LLRKVFYALMIIFFAVMTFLMVTVLITANQARQVAAPIGDLMRGLVIPATPVILPDPVIIVTEIQDLARLETASYSFEKIIRAERGDQRLLWGALGESLIFVAHGDAVAGVDLSKMSRSDLQVVDPETVMIYLPEAEIFHVRLDNQKSYVADRDTGVLVRADPQLESQVRGTAEDELMLAAEESDIRARAQTNAEAYMESFLRGLGFTNVIFTETTPPVPPPFEQDVPKGHVVTPVP
jgi:hypothetical protein